MENDVAIPNGGQSFLMYDDENGGVKLRVLMQDETIWLSQKMIAELFDTTSDNVGLHLKNIFQDGELDENATTEDFSVVQSEGGRSVRRTIRFYNLDAIISVGYRVNSKRATQFRKWATRVLTEYIRKGFVLDDERLKQGERFFQKDYFRELLERVRSIRASERRIYQQITDIFAECCIDYDAQSDITKNFYAMVQNKFLFAITGQTAPEIINERIDHNKPNAGLQTWKNAPNGRILQSDVLISKNCLTEKEIRQLERTVSGYFDYIENLIERRQELTMQAMAESVDKFLTFNEYRILEGRGRVSRAQAEKKAIAEYQIFNRTQKIESDFDRSVIKELGKQVKAVKPSRKKEG
ncbi:virulence RhuM family protein [Oxalobacter aliiformigenes]|uniref:Virulence RhuM family protein n=1 Tax=Oxalobacter aliiformigenes TaxID=2946593 RepID=A0ABY7JI46_9BURK|nr:virulence RhuM family protein [Oxalobacter aliiformigenes]WAV93587.1 virulence RhuM family protein [Oxalobacter aliiformigenes]WAV94916.1 virulence RhuM family protein [Oxalobacter aliiformigenes]WAV97282.1 virulence RhuM family protein [Oxalobacter aliiformigenes]